MEKNNAIEDRNKLEAHVQEKKRGRDTIATASGGQEETFSDDHVRKKKKVSQSGWKYDAEDERNIAIGGRLGYW